MVDVDVVVPTIGRPSLVDLLNALARHPGRVLVVDDRRDVSRPLLEEAPANVEVLPGRRVGPAGARNIGWRASRAEWVAFVDDDVVLPPTWSEDLQRDLGPLPAGVAGSQARIAVPLPGDRRPTDWERNVAGLAQARWVTADMAYRRSVLLEVGGFDERFPRAYREDADLALRVMAAGYDLVPGARRVQHPVRPASPWISLRLQAGNADDVLMRALHGPGWRERAGAPRGRRRRHIATTAAAVAAAGAGLAGRRKLAAVAGTVWLTATGELAWNRIAPGPRTRPEVVRMLATSAVLPAVATAHWVAGWVRLPRLLRRPGPSPAPRPPAAVLLDRDGTLVVDVPYNGDPDRVTPVPTAKRALDRLRAAGVPTAVVSNQSGVARGLLTRDQVDAVNRRIEEVLGPLGPWVVCVHGPEDGCDCRKPRPGLVVQAARALGVDPSDVAVIGDIGADVEAARAVGARAVLVPTAVTRPEEIAAAPEVAPTLEAAVALLLEGSR